MVVWQPQSISSIQSSMSTLMSLWNSDMQPPQLTVTGVSPMQVHLCGCVMLLSPLQ